MSNIPKMGQLPTPVYPTSDFSMEHVVLINTNRSSTNKGEDFAKNGFFEPRSHRGFSPHGDSTPNVHRSRFGVGFDRSSYRTISSYTLNILAIRSPFPSRRTPPAGSNPFPEQKCVNMIFWVYSWIYSLFLLSQEHGDHQAWSCWIWTSNKRKWILNISVKNSPQMDIVQRVLVVWWEVWKANAHGCTHIVKI